MSPESTEGKQGFIHPYHIEGSSAAARVDIILRDFERQGLADKRQIIQAACDALAKSEPAATVACTFHEQYRNMRYELSPSPFDPVQAYGVRRPREE
jgi:tripeptide aminopeptidase